MNKAVSIAQIGNNIDAIYFGLSNMTQHDYGSFTDKNYIQSDSENVVSTVSGTDSSYCFFNKNIVYTLSQNNNSNFLTSYERILPNSCGIPETKCNLPGEKIYPKDCEGTDYTNLDSNISLFSLTNIQ